MGPEITRTLEAQLIGSDWIEDAVPAGDNETLVIIRVTVVLDAAIALNSCSVIAVGLMEVLPEEASAEVVVVVELKVQLGEEDVLLDVATVTAGGLRDEEIGRGGALRRSERSWAGRSRVRVASERRGGGGGGIEGRVDPPKNLVGGGNAELVPYDRAPRAAPTIQLVVVGL